MDGPPSSPYCTTEDVAFLIKSVLSPNQHFSTATSPNTTEAERGIDLVSSQVEQQFRTAGYIVPFLPLPGEEWPTSQTAYLKMVTMLGSAAYLGGHIISPLPTRQGRSSGGENTLQALYMQELARIYIYDRVNSVEKSLSRFRAMCYNGTPAQKSIADPIGPISEAAYLGRQDPKLAYGMHAMADLVFKLKNQFELLGRDWNYAVEILRLEPWLTA